LKRSKKGRSKQGRGVKGGASLEGTSNCAGQVRSWGEREDVTKGEGGGEIKRMSQEKNAKILFGWRE